MKATTTKVKNIGNIVPLEKESILRCMEEISDPVGARNWSYDPEIVEDIKKLEIGPRLAGLREEVRVTTPQLYIKDRSKPVLESYKETEGEDPGIRQSKALAKVLREIPVNIRPGELIVGALTKTPRGAA